MNIIGSNTKEETQKSSKLDGKITKNIKSNTLNLDDLFIKYFKKYASCILWITVLYCIIVAIFIILSGCNFGYINFKLSDNVLLMLLGTATTNIIGLMAIVTKFLFSDKNLAIILNHKKSKR